MNDVAVIQTPSGELRISYQEVWDALKDALRGARKRRKEVIDMGMTPEEVVAAMRARHGRDFKNHVASLSDIEACILLEGLTTGSYAAGYSRCTAAIGGLKKE